MATGVHIIDTSGLTVYEGGGYVGHGTNNQAEYAALIAGLLTAEAMSFNRAKVYSDSECVVKQINGEYQLRAETLFDFAEVARRQVSRFLEFEIRWIPRKQNWQANAIAQLATKTLDPRYHSWFTEQYWRLLNERPSYRT